MMMDEPAPQAKLTFQICLSEELSRWIQPRHYDSNFSFRTLPWTRVRNGNFVDYWNSTPLHEHRSLAEICSGHAVTQSTQQEALVIDFLRHANQASTSDKVLIVQELPEPFLSSFELFAPSREEPGIQFEVVSPFEMIFWNTWISSDFSNAWIHVLWRAYQQLTFSPEFQNIAKRQRWMWRRVFSTLLQHSSWDGIALFLAMVPLVASQDARVDYHQLCRELAHHVVDLHPPNKEITTSFLRCVRFCEFLSQNNSQVWAKATTLYKNIIFPDMEKSLGEHNLFSSKETRERLSLVPFPRIGEGTEVNNQNLALFKKETGYLPFLSSIDFDSEESLATTLFRFGLSAPPMDMPFVFACRTFFQQSKTSSLEIVGNKSETNEGFVKLLKNFVLIHPVADILEKQEDALLYLHQIFLHADEIPLTRDDFSFVTFQFLWQNNALPLTFRQDPTSSRLENPLVGSALFPTYFTFPFLLQ